MGSESVGDPPCPHSQVSSNFLSWVRLAICISITGREQTDEHVKNLVFLRTDKRRTIPCRHYCCLSQDIKMPPVSTGSLKFINRDTLSWEFEPRCDGITSCILSEYSSYFCWMLHAPDWWHFALCLWFLSTCSLLPVFLLLFNMCLTKSLTWSWRYGYCRPHWTRAELTETGHCG